MIGTTLGSYEILEEIGRGGMGAVYKARQPSLDRIVAVKVLLPQLAADEVFVERFMREARAIATLEHQGIVTVYDVGESDGTYYFAMQLLDGKPLDEILEEGKPLSFDLATNITKQVSRALQFAHEMNVLHRDVKPGNIIVTESGGAVLTDFGIAKALSDTSLTKTGTSIGSPEYMAPEQIEGKPLDARADLYALGVVLYQMLAGEVPYKGESAVSIVYQHVKAPVPSAREANPQIPKLLDRIVSTLMAKEPDERFASAGAVLEALDGKPFVLGSEAGAAKPAPSGGSKGWIWAATAGAVVLGALGLYLLRGPGSDAAPESAPAAEPPAVEVPAEVDAEITEPSDPVEPAVEEASAEPEEAPPPAPEPRQLTITSAPPGATVILDGQALEATTPTEVAVLPDTRYELQLRLEGHDSAGWTFALDDLSAAQNRSGTLHFPLRSSIPPGVVTISADYPVTVQVRGRSYSGGTLELPPGSHSVQLSAPEVFFSQTREITVESGQSQEIQLPIAVPIKLGANPSRCRVKINGMDAGYVPADVRVTVGQHDFEFDWESLGKSLILRRRITTRSDRVFATAPR